MDYFTHDDVLDLLNEQVQGEGLDRTFPLIYSPDRPGREDVEVEECRLLRREHDGGLLAHLGSIGRGIETVIEETFPPGMVTTEKGMMEMYGGMVPYSAVMLALTVPLRRKDSSLITPFMFRAERIWMEGEEERPVMNMYAFERKGPRPLQFTTLNEVDPFEMLPALNALYLQ